MNRARLLLIALILAGCSKSKATNPVKPDTTLPGTIADLAVTATDSFSVTLAWTAPGGDGSSGTAASYEIRDGNTDVVSSTDWNQWTAVASPPAPQPAGTHQSFKVTGLSAASQYIFGMRARDDAGNVSPMSNTVMGRTTGYRTGPVLVVTSQDYPYARYSENGGRTWNNGTVNDANVRFGWVTVDPLAPYTLYATAPALGQSLLGTNADRIWKSTDHGRTWNILSGDVVSPDRDLHGGGCRPVIASPAAPGLMFVSVTGVCDVNGNSCCGNCSGAIYKSTNGGASWVTIANALPAQQLPPYQGETLPFPALAVDPTNPSRIYVGSQYWCFAVSGGTLCYSPYFYSTDGGVTWSGPNTSLLGVNIQTISVNPGAPMHLLMSTDHGIYLSEDSGVNWTSVSGTTGPLAFAFDPTNALTAYTPVGKSTDGGHTWTLLPTPTGGQREIAIDPSRHELYAVGSAGAYRSADGGSTWTQVLAATNCSSIAVLPDLPAAQLARAASSHGPDLSRSPPR